MTKSKVQLITEDLDTQLAMQGKFGKFYTDLRDDYVYFYKLKNKLQKDINKNGIRIKITNGNGIETEKPNESIQNLLKVNAQMLKILNDFGLKSPSEQPPDDPGTQAGDHDEDYLS